MKEKETRVLLVGYNGANNTGAEALLLSDIEDVRRVLGPSARITVPSLAPQNLRRYVREDASLRIVPIPILYFAALRRLVKEHDVIMLVEGSTYMDTWGSVLLWAFLWATLCAARLGKRCLAYAVDVGSLSRLNRWLVRKIASLTNLIVTRNRAALLRLASFGVRAPMEATADNAFTYRTSPVDAGWPQRAWSRARDGMMGLAVVDYSLFPVVPRAWGRKEDCYKWPYYFSRSRERRRQSERLAAGYAALADRIAAEHGLPVALIAMEEVDERLARAVRERMAHPEMARIFSSRVYNASQMTVLLRSLKLLVTCRYHAAVLSLAAQVPLIAVGHDLRLRTLFEDLGLLDQFFMEPRSPLVFEWLNERVDELLARPEQVRRLLDAGHAEHLSRALRNQSLLAREMGRSLGREPVPAPVGELATAVGGQS
ncbi:MAG TPA: polysaccharide pyruvyl transferase family protein [Spirochaetia bacterium]|nr:polysaccharide pyruvyl transferase family protein [Spirochaetia bacterium]